LHSVIFPDGSLWLKLFMPALRMVRGLLSLVLGRRRWKLVFVERPFSGWSSGQLAGKWIVSLRSELAVTNQSDQDGVVVVRVQIGRTGLAHRRILQDCHFCDIAGERVSPLSPGVLISPRTTATMQLTHPFESDRPPGERAKTLSFRVIITDQLNRRHAKRIKLQRFSERKRATLVSGSEGGQAERSPPSHASPQLGVTTRKCSECTTSWTKHERAARW